MLEVALRRWLAEGKYRAPLAVQLEEFEHLVGCVLSGFRWLYSKKLMFSGALSHAP